MKDRVIKILFVCILICISLFVGYYLAVRLNTFKAIEVINEAIQVEKPLKKYSIENLSNTSISPGEFRIKEKIDDYDEYSSYIFEFEFSPDLSEETKITTGMINIPTNTEPDGLSPLVLMVRGYVDPNLYTTGIGTSSGADYFARNGYLTLSPDFLGYAGSSEESSNVLETRFQTYTTVLSILNSLNTDSFKNISQNSWNGKINIWAHSNGGHIALTVLEITGQSIPTVLWAPVTKPFPYSVLYYTDESDDGGKFLRKVIADFEKLYEADEYSLTNYIDRITAPIQIHQGGQDDAVPQDWSDDFVSLLESKEKEVDYRVYSQADHNLRPVWDEAITQSLLFFNSN